MDYWLKQTTDQPSFSELLWSRPENKRLAGKLLIVGGNAHGFAAPAVAYQAAGEAGIGSCKVLLPDALQKTVGSVLEAAEFAPSTPSGSFARQSLEPMLNLAAWADGVLLGGDLGRNSETAVALESFIGKYGGQLTITQDAIDYFLGLANTIELARAAPPTLVITMAQLQKLGLKAGFGPAFTVGMDLLPLIRQLHDFTITYSLNIVVKHQLNIIVAVSGRVSTTKLTIDMDDWRLKTAAAVSVWWLQNPSKPFEALTSALIQA